MKPLVIDDRHFAIEFAGFSEPLRARSAEGSGEVEFRPWCFIDHLRQLRASLTMGAEGLELDAASYADGILAQGQGPTVRSEQWRPLALWWGSGRTPDDSAEPEPRVDPDGQLELDGGTSWATLRPWTWGERLIAERAHLHGGAEPEAELEFDAVAYLEAMIQGCVVELRDADGQPLDANAWQQLDARATRRLLTALVELNHPSADIDPLAAISPSLAASTLRLCAALGWTPHRVLAEPAAEVQRLLMLLDKIDDGTSRRPTTRPAARAARERRRPSIADHPDAVVIRFVDDEGGGR